MMSSPGDYAPEAGARVNSGESTTSESGDDHDNGGLSELREQAAAAMRNLADRYETESKEADALVAKLKTDLKAAEERAIRSGAEAERIRSEADRVGAKPEWLTESTSDGDDSDTEKSSETSPASETQPASETEPASASEASTESGASSEVASSESSTPVTTPDPPVPGPGPARGFAQASTPETPTATATSTQPEPPQAASASGGTGGGSEDWAPRPFESWRNQSGQVSTEVTDQ